jgi:hypothetical protein
MRRRLLAAATAGLAAAVLAACGDMHPGAAVVIDDGDFRASMEEVDDLTAALCEANPLLAEAQGQPPQSTAGVDARQYVTTLLIESYLTPLAAESADAEEPPSDEIEVSPDDLREITDQMDEDNVDEFLRLFEMANAVSGWWRSIGAQQPGATTANVEQLGQQYVYNLAGDYDIDIDPRLGLDGDNLEPQDEDVARSGSMSVAQSGAATLREDPERQADLVESLPPTQSCG